MSRMLDDSQPEPSFSGNAMIRRILERLGQIRDDWYEPEPGDWSIADGIRRRTARRARETAEQAR